MSENRSGRQDGSSARGARRGGTAALDQIRMCVDRYVPDSNRGEAEEDALTARPDNLRMEPLPPGRDRTRMGILVMTLWPIKSKVKVRFLDGEASVKRKVEEH